MIIMGLIAAFVLGGLYGLAVSYNPFIYINFLMTCCTGLVTGALVATVAKKSKTTSRISISLMALLSGLLAAYVENAVYVHIEVKTVYPISVYELLTHPHVLLGFMQLIAEQGAWSFKGTTPTGWELYSIWLIEAAVIMASSVYAAARSIMRSAFCAIDNQWMDKVTTISDLELLQKVNLSELQKQVLNGNISNLLELNPHPSGTLERTVIEIIECSICHSQKLLNVKTFSITPAKGKKDIIEKSWKKKIIIDDACCKQLLALGKSSSDE